MANGKPKMGNSASFWAYLGDAFLVLGRNLCKTSENQKNDDSGDKIRWMDFERQGLHSLILSFPVIDLSQDKGE